MYIYIIHTNIQLHPYAHLYVFMCVCIYSHIYAFLKHHKRTSCKWSGVRKGVSALKIHKSGIPISEPSCEAPNTCELIISRERQRNKGSKNV